MSRPIAHNAAAQHDVAGRPHHPQILTRIGVVHHKVGETAFDQTRQAEPLPRAPGRRPAAPPPLDSPAFSWSSSISSGA